MVFSISRMFVCIFKGEKAKYQNIDLFFLGCFENGIITTEACDDTCMHGETIEMDIM